MKVAVIGSRGLSVTDLRKYLPSDTTEIVSGGAKGVDASAREYAKANGIKLTEFLPEYEKYGRSAPLKRNIAIIECQWRYENVGFRRLNFVGLWLLADVKS